MSEGITDNLGAYVPLSSAQTEQDYGQERDLHPAKPCRCLFSEICPVNGLPTLLARWSLTSILI